MALRAQRFSRLLGGCFLFLLLLLALQKGWFGPLQSGILRTLSPLTSGVTFAVEETFGALRSFFRIGSLSRAVRILEEKNARLQSLVARRQGLEEENAQLREQLELLPRAKHTLVTADVVSRSTDGVSEALILNRGTRDGIQTGMPVIVSDGIVVGRIQSAQPYSALAVLLTDPSFRVGAETLGTNAEGLVHGVRGIGIVMDTIPRTSTVKVGDSVVTTGTDGAFPPHLLIGTIHSVDAPGNDIFQSARIAPTVNIQRLRVISVILR
jgi:rod shape-determining protein MreC